jgi:hypothetical protein
MKMGELECHPARASFFSKQVERLELQSLCRIVEQCQDKGTIHSVEHGGPVDSQPTAVCEMEQRLKGS